MENVQIGKDLGNDRNGRDRHPDNDLNQPWSTVVPDIIGTKK